MNTSAYSYSFITRSSKIHFGKYDYSKVNYVKNSIKVIIICPVHGEFLQIPNNHLMGIGCRICGINSTTSSPSDFINKSIKIHNGRYDYSLVNYINNHTKVIIICPVHGEFQQIPSAHLSGQGCKKCASLNNKKLFARSVSDFINESNKIHNGKYDYSKVNYINNKTKVIISCQIHGEFSQKPNAHLQGQGCHKCGIMKVKKSLTASVSDFISQANKIHNNKYDYSLVEYKNTHSKVIITCPVHHAQFSQTPHNHLQKHGCPKCAMEFKKKILSSTQKEFIEKACQIHKNKYTYDKTEYINSHSKIIISCKIHGNFKITPSHFLIGHGCTKCSNTYRRTNDEFKNDCNIIHDNKYDYSLTDFKSHSKKIIIICHKHGEFMQSPGHHLSGHGCPSCNESKGEKIISSFLKRNKIKYIRQYKLDKCRNKYRLPFDFYLPNYNMCIEYDGEQHFKPIEAFGGKEEFIKIKKRDKIKTDYCFNNKIKLLRISFKDNVNKILENEID